MIPSRTLERLCAYRRILFRWQAIGKERFYSHELAEEASLTASQVRRDLMLLETIGTPAHGYLTLNLIEELGLIIEGKTGQKIVLVGLGNLGRAILNYFMDRRPDLKIVAVFDNDKAKIGSTFASCRCLDIKELKSFVKKNKVFIGILTVPEDAARTTATALIEAGIRAIINFTPVRIKAPKNVFVEDLDISISLEKSAYYAQINGNGDESLDSQVELKNKDIELRKGEGMKRILCIEDDKDIIQSYIKILQKAGYEVDTAYDGESGYSKAQKNKPDLIILDVMMKDATEGFHIAYKIRADEKLKYTPILMVTSISAVSGFKFDKEKDGAYLPVDGFTEKPVAPKSLLASITKLLSLPPEQINVGGVEH